MNLKLLFLAIFTLFLAGCSTSSQNTQNEIYKTPIFRPYLENDGSLEYISFYSSKTKPKNPKVGDLLGGFFVQSGKFKDTMFFYNGIEGKSIAIANLDNDKYEPLYFLDRIAFNEISNSKKVKIYEFGKGIIETIIYTANIGICKAYKQNKIVNSKSVTNYYSDYGYGGRKDDFFSVIANSEIIGKKDIKLQNLEYKFNIKSDEERFGVIEAVKSNEFQKQVIGQDFAKQRYFLSLICN